MDATHGSLRSRTVMILVACAFALPVGQARAATPAEPPPEPVEEVREQQQLAVPDPSALPAPASEPVVVPQDPAPVVIDGGAELDADEAEAPELLAQPAGERESAPPAEPDPVPAPERVNTTLPPTDVPAQVPEPPPLEAPKPGTRVGPSPGPPPRSAATADPGPRLLAKVDVLLRRVEERMRRLTSELDAGKTPADSSLRELRQDVEELAPAVVALQRRAAARASHELDTVGVERRLRRVLRRTAVLVAALARSGVDTAESSRLLIVLERFATASATGPAPRHAGSSHPGAAAADAQLAYTRTSATFPQSWSGILSQDPYPAATVSWPRRDASPALDGDSLTQLAGSAASTHFSALSLAALALLLGLAVSGSLSALVLSSWEPRTSTTASAPSPRRPRGRRPSRAGHPPRSACAPSRRRRTSTSA
jgi:hypothetical protein